MLQQAQQDDLTALGRLTLALACRSIHCDNLPASMDLVARTYSADLKNLILYVDIILYYSLIHVFDTGVTTSSYKGFTTLIDGGRLGGGDV